MRFLPVSMQTLLTDPIRVHRHVELQNIQMVRAPTVAVEFQAYVKFEHSPLTGKKAENINIKSEIIFKVSLHIFEYSWCKYRTKSFSLFYTFFLCLFPVRYNIVKCQNKRKRVKNCLYNEGCCSRYIYDRYRGQ